MGILNWVSNSKKRSDKNSNNGGDITVGKALAFNEAYSKLEDYFFTLIHYVDFVLISEKEIKNKIDVIRYKTGRNLDTEVFLRKLLILRYSYAYKNFFNLNPPKNEQDVEIGISLIEKAFQVVLEKNKRVDDFVLVKKGFSDYTGLDKICLDNLEKIDKNFSEFVLNIGIESAGKGKWTGELIDFVVELITTIIFEDQKVFIFEKASITKEESGFIKDYKDSVMKLREKDFKDFADFINRPDSSA